MLTIPESYVIICFLWKTGLTIPAAKEVVHGVGLINQRAAWYFTNPDGKILQLTTKPIKSVARELTR